MSISSYVKKNTVKPSSATAEPQNNVIDVKYCEELKKPRKIETDGFILNYSGALFERKKRDVARSEQVIFEPINMEDSFEFNKRVKIERKVKKGVVRADLKYPPAIIIKPPEIDESQFNAKQLKYRRNIITPEELRKPTPKKHVAKNRSGLLKYIFVNEVLRCKNALLYYLVPLILDIIFMIHNIAVYPFFENVLISTTALVTFLILRKIFKNEENFFTKFFQIVLLALIIGFGIWAWHTYFNESFNKIYLPYAIKLLFCVSVLYHFGKYYAIFAIMYAQDCSLNNNVVVSVKAGAPGNGKTSQAVQDGIVIALKKWNDLQFLFWSMHSQEDDILKRNDNKELMLYHEVKRAYNFYAMNPGIPCFWCNFEVTDNKGRKNYEVTLDHLRGVKCLPLYSVVVYDELGAVLKSELGFKKGDVYDVSDMFRLGRQFLEWTFIGCEQDYNNIFIDCRRVVGENVVMLNQEWICRPTLLYGLYKILAFTKADSLDGVIKRQPKRAKLINKLGNFVFSIGFRRQSYQRFGNTQTGAMLGNSNIDPKMLGIGKIKYRYVSSNVIADYDDRDYRKVYASEYDREIDGNVYVGSYSKQLEKVSTTDLLAEKRQATKDLIEKII